jgi:hypothetical protein
MNLPSPATCPTCRDLVPIAWTGRPRTYCTDDCRREMARRRRDLAALEAELVEVRYLASVHHGFWSPAHVRSIEGDVAKARARIPEEVQP